MTASWLQKKRINFCLGSITILHNGMFQVHLRAMIEYKTLLACYIRYLVYIKMKRHAP